MYVLFVYMYVLYDRRKQKVPRGYTGSCCLNTSAAVLRGVAVSHTITAVRDGKTSSRPSSLKRHKKKSASVSFNLKHDYLFTRVHIYSSSIAVNTKVYRALFH